MAVDIFKRKCCSVSVELSHTFDRTAVVAHFIKAQSGHEEGPGRAGS